MSSDRKGQNKKVNSIAKKLNRRLKRKKLRIYAIGNWFAAVLCFVVYVLTMEYGACGNLQGAAMRKLTWSSETAQQFMAGSRAAIQAAEEGFEGATTIKWGTDIVRLEAAFNHFVENADMLDNLILYQSVREPAEMVVGEAVPALSTFEIPVAKEMSMDLAMVIALRALQLLTCTISSGVDRRRIRRALSPIDEIAVKADELARMEFDESKYHNLEEKIAGLDPNDTLPVTQGGGELENIENAINNLLLRMRESNRQQARFVNDASHELRTPIAVIEGYANMLARWGREDEKVLDESIQAIQHESSHMKYLVEQLLFLARGDSGRTVVKLEDISLTDMMREIYEESLMIDEKHVYRFDSIENEDIRLNCDPALLKQAVRILVDNAAKYTNEKDEIQLGVGRNAEGRPYLQVEDAGIGMAESDVTHMFERFYRSDEVRSYQGTGLGLSIAKWIVDKHNGHFEVISRESIGTRIRVVL